MDPWISVGLRIVFLLGGAVPRSEGSTACPCPDLPHWNLTIRPSQECRQINSTYRYTCVDGYVRKAGTSNRIKCQLMNGRICWDVKSTTLECIEDPRRQKTHPTTSKDKSSGHAPVTAVTATTTSTACTKTEMKQNASSSHSEDQKSIGPVLETTLTSLTPVTTTLPENDHDTQAGTKENTVIAAVIPSVLLVLGVIVIGVIVCRRRSNARPVSVSGEEHVPMNPAQ